LRGSGVSVDLLSEAIKELVELSVNVPEVLIIGLFFI
jgi:hypothetical protein